MKKERKKKFSKLAKRLRGMTEQEKLDLVVNAGIRNVDGREMSLNNTCLLLFQSEAVPTVVGGYRQWQNASRQVKAGEHGMMIWYPSSRKKDEDSDEEEETRFYVGTVFDISQTEEKPEY